MKLETPLALCSPRRLPFSQIGKALAKYSAVELGAKVAGEVVQDSKLSLEQFDGVVVGKVSPMRPTQQG